MVIEGRWGPLLGQSEKGRKAAAGGMRLEASLGLQWGHRIEAREANESTRGERVGREERYRGSRDHAKEALPGVSGMEPREWVIKVEGDTKGVVTGLNSEDEFGVGGGGEEGH